MYHNEPTPMGYKRVPYHLIFACKMNLRHKTRLVIDKNRSPPVHKEDYYARITFCCVAENFGNTFLLSFTTEKSSLLLDQNLVKISKENNLFTIFAVLQLIIMNLCLINYKISNFNHPVLIQTYG